MTERESFADHFSASAAAYAAFRPRYPRRLFEMLADLCPRRELAWDCATGSGQAASGLVEHFDRVIATDASAQQIALAEPHPRIDYRVAPAERSEVDAQSADIVAVAQALHWLRLDEFYAEVRRVLRPGGILAVWCYAIFQVEGDEVDGALRRFYDETVGPFWSPERRLVEEGYRALPFPFEEVSIPTTSIEADLDLRACLGYVATWSAVKRYRDARREDPIPALHAGLTPLWGDPARRRRVRWPILMRAGRI
jgi:ubiquinone/menaquinone biosynthesis C-methylase UbiE